jgi:phosphatidate cytidylyltransferase
VCWSPLGGFYASAIKRAYKIKDFDSLFPGHGGVMDRVDCQLFMVAFTTVHYLSLIAPSQTPSVDLMLSMFHRMTSRDQLQLVQEVNC